MNLHVIEKRLRDAAAVQLELAHEHLALADRHGRTHDELERLADRVHADEHDRSELAEFFRRLPRKGHE